MKDERYLKEVITKEVFIPKGKERFVSPRGVESNWLFDFRRVLMKPRVLHAVAQLFLKQFKKVMPFQIGGIEVAAIPLVTGLAMALSEEGYDINAFFIRKSRKKDGLLKMVEGAVNAEKIILVDDIINTGKSFIRQVEVIESLGKKVGTVFAILRFRDLDYYKYFHERGIKVVSLFTLDDFSDILQVNNLVSKEEKPVPTPFKAEWYFKSEGADFFHVIPKSRPALDEKCLYFGSDSGILWALNQKDGSVAWKRQIGFAPKAKHIFSSPALHEGVLYIGAHDGNFYAFNADDGNKRWMFAEADWIHSSPCVAPDLGLVIVGLEYGWWHKKGAVVALDLETGEKRWEHRTGEYAYASPTYSKKHRMVLCGSNDDTMYALDAVRGTLLWGVHTDGDVRGCAAIDYERGLAIFGSMDSYVYIVRLNDGKCLHKVAVEGGILSDPLIHDARAYVTSLDKNVYCIDIDSGTIVWKFYARARIFSSPIFVNGKIYFGSNDARFYELDAATGKETAFFQATERITNAVAYNPKTKRIFLPTFANEIYCLKRVPNRPKDKDGIPLFPEQRSNYRTL